MKNSLLLQSARYLLALLPVILLSAGTVRAQTEINAGMKMVMIYKFSQQVEWPDEQQIDTFRIGVYGVDPPLMRELRLLESVRLRDNPIKIYRFTRIRDLAKTQVLYITPDRNYEIEKVNEQVKGNHTLLITDRCQDQNLIMINFLPLVENKIRFEVNKANMINDKLTALPDLLLLGGNEIDVAELYRESQEALQRVIQQVASLYDSLGRQDVEIRIRNEEIAKQESEIDSSNRVLDSIQLEISGQEQKIEEQKSQLTAYASLVERQKFVLYVFIIFLVLIMGLIFFIYRGYKIKQRANRVLEDVMQEITARNTEINKQKKEIEDKNLELQSKNEEIVAQAEELRQANEEIMATNEALQNQKAEVQYTLENLKLTQDQLVQSEKLASLGQLTAGIAHELNNPVNFISGNINPLKRDLEDLFRILSSYGDTVRKNKLEGTFEEVDKVKEELDFQFLTKEITNLLDGIGEGAHRSTEIVKGLRSFSRLDDEKFIMADVHDGLDSTLILLYNKTKNRINIHKDYGDLPLIECLPSRLNQVFMNILTNSIQAIKEKGDIHIETIGSGIGIKIVIRDNGVGMIQEVKKRIFEPFFTTKEVGSGTGLGLSISYGIIEQHKGNIDVISEPGKGTEFIISLPITQSDT